MKQLNVNVLISALKSTVAMAGIGFTWYGRADIEEPFLNGAGRHVAYEWLWVLQWLSLLSILSAEVYFSTSNHTTNVFYSFSYPGSK